MGDPLRRKDSYKKPKHSVHETFGAVADKLRANGFVPIPLNGKQPLDAKNWSGFWKNPPSEKAYESWKKRNTHANVGLCLGEVIAVDIDLDDKVQADTMQQTVFEALGSSDFIRVGREPRRTIFYQLRFEEAMQASNWKVGKVELLAAGKQSAVFGTHPDTRKPFLWPQKSILGVSIKEIPLTTIEQLEALKAKLKNPEGIPLEEKPETRFSMQYLPKVGERDRYLFWYAKELAATTSAKEDLVAAVLGKNASFGHPLTEAEAKEKATSAWSYKEEGLLWLSGASAPIVILIARTVMAKHIKELDPQAAKLLLGLASTRHNQKEFTIPQKATAEAFRMAKGSLDKGLKQLIKLGIIMDVGKTKRVSSQSREAKLYRFGDGSAPVRAMSDLL